MKKLIIAVAILSFGFTSCKEECKDCTTTSTIDETIMTEPKEYCGDQLDDIDGETRTLSGAELKTTCE